MLSKWNTLFLLNINIFRAYSVSVLHIMNIFCRYASNIYHVIGWLWTTTFLWGKKKKEVRNKICLKALCLDLFFLPYRPPLWATLFNHMSKIKRYHFLLHFIIQHIFSCRDLMIQPRTYLSGCLWVTPGVNDFLSLLRSRLFYECCF